MYAILLLWRGSPPRPTLTAMQTLQSFLRYCPCCGAPMGAAYHRSQPGAGRKKGGLPKPLQRLQTLLQGGLTTTAALWPDVRRAFGYMVSTFIESYRETGQMRAVGEWIPLNANPEYLYEM